jgi:hypothetical protein
MLRGFNTFRAYFQFQLVGKQNESTRAIHIPSLNLPTHVINALSCFNRPDTTSVCTK